MHNNRGVVFLFFLLGLSLKVYFIYTINTHLRLNDDDERNYMIAQNYVAGKGYGIYDRRVGHFRLSAYHTSSTVFLYQFLITQNIPKDALVIAFYIISTILYLLAVWYLYRILQLLQVKLLIRNLAIAIFAFYPSVMYAIGPLYHFDNMLMPLHVIHFYYLLQWVRGKVPQPRQMILLILSITLCCFLRSQVVPLYFITGCYLLLLYIKDKTNWQRNYKIPVFWGLMALCIVFTNLPALIKNKKMFNVYVISTQAGFEFLQGHNAYNRGNWILPERGNALEKYVHLKFPNIDAMDEYTEGKLRNRLAWEWIRAHPELELKYTLKKMMRYFIPENAVGKEFNLFLRYHPFTIFVHGLFLTSVVWSLFRNRSLLFSKEVRLLMIPVITMLLLSVAFYFDKKLRYHAEPFMIILSACLLDAWIKKRRKEQL